MRGTVIARLIVLASSVFWVGISFADTYKWLDADGNIVYSQTVPSGGQPVETLKKVEPVELEPEPLDEEAQALQDLDQQISERKARIKKNCKVARRNKALLETTANIVGPDEAGNEVLLSTSEKVGRLAEATDQVQTYCS